MTEQGTGHAETGVAKRMGATHTDTANRPLEPTRTTAGWLSQGDCAWIGCRETLWESETGNSERSQMRHWHPYGRRAPIGPERLCSAVRGQEWHLKPNAHGLRPCVPHEGQGHGPGVTTPHPMVVNPQHQKAMVSSHQQASAGH